MKQLIYAGIVCLSLPLFSLTDSTEQQYQATLQECTEVIRALDAFKTENEQAITVLNKKEAQQQEIIKKDVEDATQQIQHIIKEKSKPASSRGSFVSRFICWRRQHISG